MTTQEEIAPLKTQLEKTADEKEQVELLIELLRSYTARGREDTQPYIDRLLQLAEKLNDSTGKAWGLHYLANLKRFQGELDTSLDLSQQSLLLFQQTNLRYGIAHARKNIGSINYLQSDYPEALKNYLFSLQIFEEIGDKRGIIASYTNMGNIHQHQKNYPEALKNYLLALKLDKEIGDKRGIAISYHNIGDVHLELENFPEALQHYLLSLKIKEEIGDKRGIAVSYTGIGSVHLLQRSYREALNYHLLSLKIKEEIGDKRGIAGCYNDIGSVYLNQENFTEALKNHLLALQIAEEIGFKEVIKDCSQFLTNIYKTIGDFENALKHYEKYQQIETEIYGMDVQRQISQLNFQREREQKEKELEIEHLRNVELKMEKDRSENLLLNILPSEVAEELKDKGTATARLFNNVTVLYTDFKSFTTASERLTPQELVDELHACFSAFDEIVSKHNVEKIKTVGDSYLAVSGLPLIDDKHAENILKAAIEIRNFCMNRRKELGDKTFEIRIGIHSGSVVAGIVGVKKFVYDIWGDTVNTAARMEQNSEAGKINISETTYQLIRHHFKCEYRGEIDAKNKGRLKMYFMA